MLEDCLRVLWVRALVSPQASVLFLDIVDFTRTCSAQSCEEAAAWMGRVHHAIDTRIRRHALRSYLLRPLAGFLPLNSPSACDTFLFSTHYTEIRSIFLI